MIPGLGVEGIQKSIEAAVAVDDADQHFAFRHQGRSRRVVSLAPLSDLALPQYISVRGVQCNQKSVCRSEVDLVLKRGRTSVWALAVGRMRQNVLIVPDQP